MQIIRSFCRNVVDNHLQLQHLSPVIHCVCNSVNTRLVDEAAAQGGRTPACVMKHCGKRFNCGQCIPSIEERLRVVIGDAANDRTVVQTPAASPLLDAAE